MHAMPRGHREGAPVDGAEKVGRAAVAGVIAGNDGFLDLWSGPGRTESSAYGLEIFSRRSRLMQEKNTALLDVMPVTLNSNGKNGHTLPAAKPVSFTLNGKPIACGSDETILEAAQRNGVEIPRLCY